MISFFSLSFLTYWFYVIPSILLEKAPGSCSTFPCLNATYDITELFHISYFISRQVNEVVPQMETISVVWEV